MGVVGAAAARSDAASWWPVDGPPGGGQRGDVAHPDGHGGTFRWSTATGRRCTTVTAGGRPTAPGLSLPLGQAELADDEVTLGQLGLFQVEGVTRPGGPVAAGVDHRRPEDELVERVADVVVVGDGRGVARLGVQATRSLDSSAGGRGGGPTTPSRSAAVAIARLVAASTAMVRPSSGSAKCSSAARPASMSPSTRMLLAT